MEFEIQKSDEIEIDKTKWERKYRLPYISRYISDKLSCFIFIAYCHHPIGYGWEIREYINYIDILCTDEELGAKYLEAIEYSKTAKYYEGINDGVPENWKVITKERSHKSYHEKTNFMHISINDDRYIFIRANRGRNKNSPVFGDSPTLCFPTSATAEEIGQAIRILFDIPENELPKR